MYIFMCTLSNLCFYLSLKTHVYCYRTIVTVLVVEDDQAVTVVSETRDHP